jgi:hypothetical protein
MSSPFQKNFMQRLSALPMSQKQEDTFAPDGTDPVPAIYNSLKKDDPAPKGTPVKEIGKLSNSESSQGKEVPGMGGLNTGNYYIPGGGQGTGGQSITKGMSQEPIVINAKGSNNNISSGKTRVEHRADKTRVKIESTNDAVVKRRRVARLARLEKRAAKKEIRQGKRYARKKDKGARIDAKFKGGVEGQGGKDYTA